jgi:hypothetical protein
MIQPETKKKGPGASGTPQSHQLFRKPIDSSFRVKVRWATYAILKSWRRWIAPRRRQLSRWIVEWSLQIIKAPRLVLSSTG